MPTYDYRCEKCGNEFEEFLPMAKRIEPTEEPCDKQLHRAAPVCGGKISQIPGLTPPAFTYDRTVSDVMGPHKLKGIPGSVKDKKVINKYQMKI